MGPTKPIPHATLQLTRSTSLFYSVGCKRHFLCQKIFLQFPASRVSRDRFRSLFPLKKVEHAISCVSSHTLSNFSAKWDTTPYQEYVFLVLHYANLNLPASMAIGGPPLAFPSTSRRRRFLVLFFSFCILFSSVEFCLIDFDSAFV